MSFSSNKTTNDEATNLTVWCYGARYSSARCGGLR